MTQSLQWSLQFVQAGHFSARANKMFRSTLFRSSIKRARQMSNLNHGVPSRLAFLSSRLATAFFLSLLSNPAFALDNVTLQLKWTHAFQFAGYYAAKEQGYYRDAGLKVNIVEAAPDTDPVRNVLEGKAQYGVGTSSLLLERAAGKPVVALAVVFQQSPYEIYAAPHIRSLHDLIGKRIMLEPQSDELLAYLQKEGIPLDRIRQVPHSFDAAGLMEGKTEAIAGYITNQPFYFRQAQYPFQIFNPRSAGIDFYGDNLFTSEQELQAHPARVKAFRAASLRGWQYAKEHRDEMIALILAKYSQKHTREYLRFESDQMIPLLQPNLIEIGYMNPNRWHDIASTYADIGLLPRDFALKGFLYDASEPDLTWFYRALAAALIIIGMIASIALYIYRINRKLQHANRTIERALSEHGRFMDMLTHELKTPISVVRMALGAMKVQGALKDHADRALEDMNDIIERCRQMGQLEQQKLVPYLQRCRLDEILAELQSNSFAPDRLSITTEPLPELNTDTQLLRIILGNLISNAIKYSPPESVIDIHAGPARHGGKNGVRVTVQNQPGTAGLPDPEKLFDKYYRSPAAGSKSGSGLGLYLVRSITGLLGGQVAYDVAREKVRFTLWIPC